MPILHTEFYRGGFSRAWLSGEISVLQLRDSDCSQTRLVDWAASDRFMRFQTRSTQR
jgi:hypothetical protein